MVETWTQLDVPTRWFQTHQLWSWKLLEWSSQSPDFNPVEYLWAIIKNLGLCQTTTRFKWTLPILPKRARIMPEACWWLPKASGQHMHICFGACAPNYCFHLKCWLYNHFTLVKEQFKEIIRSPTWPWYSCWWWMSAHNCITLFLYKPWWFVKLKRKRANTFPHSCITPRPLLNVLLAWLPISKKQQFPAATVGY